MSIPKVAAKDVPSLDEFKRKFANIYTLERSKKSAWRVRRVLGQIQALGITHLRQIDRETLSEWRASVSDLAPRTQKSYYSTLCTALRFAVKSGWIRYSPADVLEMRFSRRKVTKTRHLSLAEIGSLFSLLSREAKESWEGHRLYVLTLVIYTTGMRPGEAHRLRADEVLLNDGLIDLTQRPCKTEASSDYIGLPDFTCDALAKWLPEAGSEWIFPHSYRTGPWLYGSPGKTPLERLQQAGRRAGVEYVTFAMGRHSFVTHGSTKWGLTRSEVQYQTRHTTEAMQDYYRHFDACAKRGAVRSIKLPGLELAATNTEGEGCLHGQEAGEKSA